MPPLRVLVRFLLDILSTVFDLLAGVLLSIGSPAEPTRASRLCLFQVLFRVVTGFRQGVRGGGLVFVKLSLRVVAIL